MSRQSDFIAKLVAKGPQRARSPYATAVGGNKGLRLVEVKLYFIEAFGSDAGLVHALNELISEKRLLAVNFEWQTSEWNTRKKTVKNVEKLDRVDGEGNPMFYTYENQPKPIAKALKTSADIRDHARTVLREIGN
jgi:hypothetical protein